MSALSEPSAEAVEAANERMENFRGSERWDRGGRQQKTDAVLTAAYAIDLPRVRAEAREQTIAEVVAWLGREAIGLPNLAAYVAEHFKTRGTE